MIVLQALNHSSDSENVMTNGNLMALSCMWSFFSFSYYTGYREIQYLYAVLDSTQATGVYCGFVTTHGMFFLLYFLIKSIYYKNVVAQIA